MNLLLGLLFLSAWTFTPTEAIYHGSTPVSEEVKDFLDIKPETQVDFVRWKLATSAQSFSLVCSYGISKPNTNGFIDPIEVRLTGSISTDGSYLTLASGSGKLNMVTVNANLLYMLDKDKRFLIGDGGYSFVLNNISPSVSGNFNLTTKPVATEKQMIFQGQTPCSELLSLMGREERPECIKIKWYIVLHRDAATGQPTFFTKGSRQIVATRGTWEYSEATDGTSLYKLNGLAPKPVYLKSAQDMVLFFTDAEGNLLVGNDNFSFVLNRTDR